MPELIKQREKLNDLILEVAKKYPYRFTVKIRKDIQINNLKVRVRVVNNQHIEVHVISECETVLKIRHFESYVSTVNMVLNFINLNF